MPCLNIHAHTAAFSARSPTAECDLQKQHTSVLNGGKQRAAQKGREPRLRRPGARAFPPLRAGYHLARDMRALGCGGRKGRAGTRKGRRERGGGAMRIHGIVGAV